MKTAIIFYSFSGKTRRACQFLKNKLIASGNEAVLLDLRPQNEQTSFLLQCWQASRKKNIRIKICAADIKDCDLFIFASPVWAFTFAPALRTYLSRLSSLEDKRCVAFLTYHSGAGREKALKELENTLRKKKGYILFSKNLSGEKTGDENYLNQEFRDLLMTFEREPVPVAQSDRA